MEFIAKLIERLQELLVVPGHTHSLGDCLDKLLELWKTKQFNLEYLGCIMFLGNEILKVVKPNQGPVMFGGVDETELLRKAQAVYGEVSGDPQPPFGMSMDAAAAGPFGAGGTLVMILLPLLKLLLEAWLKKS